MAAELLRPALSNTEALILPRAALLEAIRQVRITADPTSCAIALHLHPAPAGGTDGAGVRCRVTARDRYGNAAAADITGVGWAGPARTVVVNHAFLTDLIAGHRAATLTFRLGPDTRTRPSAVLLRDDDTGRVGVIGQMRADWVGQ